MIPNELAERIAADVSGDLMPADVERLRQDLAKSPEARRLHRALQKDVDAVRNLPKRAVGIDLAPKVLAALAAQSPIIVLRKNHNSVRQTRWPQVFGLCMGLALAFVTAWLITKRGGTEQAKVDDDTNPTFAAGPTPSGKPEVPEPEASAPNVVIDNPEPQEQPKKPISASNSPIAKPSDVLTAPLERSVSPVQVTMPRTSLPFFSGDMSEDATREPFRKELKRDRDHRLEFFSHDTNRLLDDFTRAVKARSSNLVIEPAAAEHQRRRVKSSFAIYLESWSANDFLTVTRGLAKDGTFQNMVLAPINDGDRREMKQLLGRDPFDLNIEPVAKNDSRRSMADKTAEGLAQALDTASKADNQMGGPVGYVSLFPPPKSGGISKDQQQFWERRAERLAGKLRVYLILRPLS